MFYDLSFIWIWLVLTLILGGAIGWRGEVPGEQSPLFEGMFRNIVIGIVVLFVAVLLHLLPGRLGFWLETAVLFAIFYIAGCFAGGALQRMAAARGGIGVGLGRK